jgi:hypothetical protein
MHDILSDAKHLVCVLERMLLYWCVGGEHLDLVSDRHLVLVVWEHVGVGGVGVGGVQASCLALRHTPDQRY